MAHAISDVRTFTLIGPGDSGKTSLVDAIAFLAKTTPRHGSVVDGSSISNTEAEEKERKHTLASHLFHCNWKGKFVQLLDTPGHPDFLADAISSLHAVEAACLVLSSTTGLSFHARRLFGEAERAGIARAILVSKLDAENTDFGQLLANLVSVLGDRVVPITYPDGNGKSFKTIHSTLAGQGPDAARYRSNLEERVAEVDDKLMEKYFEAGTLAPEELSQYLPKAMVAGKLIPLFVVSPPQTSGVPEFLDFVTSYFPAPSALPPRVGHELEDASKPVTVPITEDGPFAGFVFKVVVDPYVGRLSYIKVLRGALAAEGHIVWNARTRKSEKLAGIHVVQGKDTAPVPKASAGEIVALPKIETLGYSDTVCAENAPVVFNPIVQPKPMVALAIAPESRGDEQKIGGAVEKIHAEDPTFIVKRDADTHEMVAYGMSNLHLDILFHKIKRRYHVGIVHHAPRIPYRETIMGKAEGHHRHKKQTGGRGQFGECYLRVFAKERGAGFEYIDSVVGGSIPRQFIPEIEKGIRQILTKGIIAGYPVVDVAAEVYDGKFHDVDSDQISFQLAGKHAFAEGFEKARPVLLEPVMNLEIHVPTRFTGDITGNLNSKRGRLSGMDADGDIQIIKAQVPLKEVQDYSTILRSITAGEGTFTMEFSHYDPVPPHLQAEIINHYKKTKVEEAS